MSQNTLTRTDNQATEIPGQNGGARPAFRPQVDIVEKGEAIFLVADMPGVDEQSVEVTVEKDVLTLHGTVTPPSFEGLTPGYCEYRIGDYRRVFQLSNEVDRGGIEATVRHGVLTVKLPKAQHALNTKVPVKAG